MARRQLGMIRYFVALKVEYKNKNKLESPKNIIDAKTSNGFLR